MTDRIWFQRAVLVLWLLWSVSLLTIGAFLNVAVLWGLTGLAGLYYLASNLFGIGISTLWNYGFNSNITWEVPVRHRTSKPLSRK